MYKYMFIQATPIAFLIKEEYKNTVYKKYENALILYNDMRFSLWSTKPTVIACVCAVTYILGEFWFHPNRLCMFVFTKCLELFAWFRGIFPLMCYMPTLILHIFITFSLFLTILHHLICVTMIIF